MDRATSIRTGTGIGRKLTEGIEREFAFAGHVLQHALGKERWRRGVERPVLEHPQSGSSAASTAAGAAADGACRGVSVDEKGWRVGAGGEEGAEGGLREALVQAPGLLWWQSSERRGPDACGACTWQLTSFFLTDCSMRCPATLCTSPPALRRTAAAANY